MMTTELQVPPALDITAFQITEQTEYFWPEIWNAKITWLQAWYDYLVAQAAYYQQAIASAGDDLRAEMHASMQALSADIVLAQQSIAQTMAQQQSYVEQVAHDAVSTMDVSLSAMRQLQTDVAADAAVVASGLAAVNLPAFTPADAGAVMMTNGDGYQLARPLFRPPTF